MKRDEDFFGDQDLSLIYIAKRLKDALRLEEILTAHGIEYLVEPDTYRGGIIFPAQRVGAFFYVPVLSLPSTRTLMQEAGFPPYQTEE